MKTDELVRNVKEQVKALNPCGKFSGEEDLQGLCRLLMSPQGFEFCTDKRYPTMPILQEFKAAGVERYGVYIDSDEEITMTDGQRICVAGHSNMVIHCGGHGLYRIYGMKNASFDIKAYGWAVVKIITDNTCHIVKAQKENSIIL